MVSRGLAASRSQAERLVKLGRVKAGGRPATRPGMSVSERTVIELLGGQPYVSRAAYKLEDAATALRLDFSGKTVLDVGSSSGGFSDYALRHGAGKVIAVDVGSGQMHPLLRAERRVKLHEKTDIRTFATGEAIDLALIDVSFISIRDVLPSVAALAHQKTLIVALLKPQFEAGKTQTAKGVIKNERVRREIFKSFESWAKPRFLVIAKHDSAVTGTKGNRERFYLLSPLQK